MAVSNSAYYHYTEDSVGKLPDPALCVGATACVEGAGIFMACAGEGWVQLVTGAFKGVIVQWYGALADIPAGWVLCDGQNGTPDLRGRFIRGATAGADPGAIGSIKDGNAQDYPYLTLAYLMKT